MLAITDQLGRDYEKLGFIGPDDAPSNGRGCDQVVVAR